MKMRYRSHISILFGLLAVLGSNLLVSTAIAALTVIGPGESFEAGTFNYSLTGEFGSGGVTDYFEVIPNNGTRVDSTIITTSGIFANADGDSVLASDDSNAAGTNPVSLLLNSVTTSGFTDLSFSLLLAASNPTQGGPTRGFELLDRVEILIDTGSGFTQLAIFKPAGGGTNTYLSLNGTNTGSGTAATDIEQGFKEFSFPFTAASSAQFRIDIQGDTTGEYIAIDNVRVLGTAVSEPTADFDNDGDVDGHDFLVWQRGGTIPPLGAADLVLWQTKYGSPLPLNADSNAVPEPSTWVLLSLTTIGVNFVRRRRIA